MQLMLMNQSSHGRCALHEKLNNSNFVEDGCSKIVTISNQQVPTLNKTNKQDKFGKAMRFSVKIKRSHQSF